MQQLGGLLHICDICRNSVERRRYNICQRSETQVVGADCAQILTCVLAYMISGPLEFCVHSPLQELGGEEKIYMQELDGEEKI